MSCFELLAILVEIDELTRHAGRNCGPRDCWCDPEQDARIEREGNEIVGAELYGAQTIEARHAVGNVFFRKQCKRASRGHLHRFVHFSRACVERAAEDERETQDVVDLVRIVAASRGDDRVSTNSAYFFGQDLRFGVRQCEDDGTRCHLHDHVASYSAGNRKTDKDIGPIERVL